MARETIGDAVARQRRDPLRMTIQDGARPGGQIIRQPAERPRSVIRLSDRQKRDIVVRKPIRAGQTALKIADRQIHLGGLEKKVDRRVDHQVARSRKDQEPRSHAAPVDSPVAGTSGDGGRLQLETFFALAGHLDQDRKVHQRAGVAHICAKALNQPIPNLRQPLVLEDPATQERQSQAVSDQERGGRRDRRRETEIDHKVLGRQ